VVAGVENCVESMRPGGAGRNDGLVIRLLGPLVITRRGKPLPFPRSRKVRALVAYLVLAPRAVTRSQLCELLWEVPNDPRSELRWCLSKIRALLDERGRRRVQTEEDTVRVDLDDCIVDAIEIARAIETGIDGLAIERSRSLVALFAGDFLEGLEVEHSPLYHGWMTAQRRRFRNCHVALLERLALSAAQDEAFEYLEKWLQLAPYEQRAHELLLAALARRGRIREGEEHLATTGRLFDAEGLDWAPLREAWRSALKQATSPAVEVVASAAPPAAATQQAAGARRASIAVMPFLDWSSTPVERGGAADALAHDVITRLAKLRSMFVIGQGSVFALHERRIGAEEAGRMLNVDYVVSGSVRLLDKRLTVRVELAETRTARVVWAEVFDQTPEDAFRVLDEIGNRIVASLAAEIETIERNRAVLKPPNSLDAWEAHHRGLWHMYQFTKADNARARHFFQTAVRLDPTFARAHAGLSFTHFQNAFQGWAKGAAEVERAYAAAGQSLAVDDRDPTAHWAMGRALWLLRRHEPSVAELQCATDLSPNFALGHYALAFVQSQAGDPQAAIAASDYSRSLSPFDPLLFGMLGTRAMALVRLGRYDEAAGWAVQAAARPNAHPHIHAIAAFSLALAGSSEEALRYAATVRKMSPRYRARDFLNAFHFDDAGAARFTEGARRLGMD